MKYTITIRSSDYTVDIIDFLKSLQYAYTEYGTWYTRIQFDSDRDAVIFGLKFGVEILRENAVA